MEGRTWLVGVMSLLLVLMVALGCEEPKPGPTPCQSTNDCTGGQVCNGGTCGNCSDDAACGKGRLCLDSLCRLGCRSDDGCRPGERCSQGVCIGGCTEDVSCPTGQTCADGVCRAACATRADCADKLYCNTAAGTCQECVTNDHCEAGYFCQAGKCACASNSLCSNKCVDLKVDATNCGQCGVTCRLSLCVDGICRLVAKQVVLGGTHTCALMENDTVQCWGSNGQGELGNGDQQEQTAPVAANGVSNVKQLSLLGSSPTAGNSSTCALHNDGKVSCWGSGDYGELGNGTPGASPTPVVIQSLSGVLQITSGKGTMIDGKVAGFHRCALLQDSTVWCWGSNRFGEIGDRSLEQRNAPVEVDSIKDLVQVEGGGGHTCALTRGGKVWCWGNNVDGQLGIKGSATSTAAPVDVADLDDVTHIAVGLSHSCAALKSGGVKCWGSNADGQLGDGTNVNVSRRTPVEVKGLSDVVSLSAGRYHTCALQRSGSAVCWGRNKFGVLGIGSLTDVMEKPTALPFKDIIQLAVGHVHTCVIRKTSQSIWCWGQGDKGQLGNRERLALGTPTQVIEE